MPTIKGTCSDNPVVDASITSLLYVINSRGVHINRAGLMACIDVFNQAQEKYTDELKLITGQAVQTVDELTKGVGERMAYNSIGGLPFLIK